MGDLTQSVSDALPQSVVAQIDRFARTRAIGSAPELVAFAILSLRLAPTMEGAADFAADSVGGRLGRSLESYRRRTPTGRQAFDALADEWGDLDPSLERAVSLMQVAVDTPSENRPAILDSALDAVLEGSRDRVATFGTEIRGPAMGIYAFGVMLPLALVGMLPVLSTTGGSVSMVVLGVFYDLLLPLGLIGAGLWLAARRPAVATPSFDTRMVTAEGVWQAVGIGLAAALLGWVTSPLFYPAWTRWLVAPGVGIGSALLTFVAPIRDRQREIDDLESGLPDVLTIVGRQVADGSPTERALETVGERVSGRAGEYFERAGETRKLLGATVESALTGGHGVFHAVPSRRARTVSSLVVRAGAAGRPGGQILVAVGEYLETLQQVEREGRRELAQTTSTLRQTAVVFAPVIAGVTVALATGMDTGNMPGSGLDVGTLGLVIGGYVLQLGVVLPSLAVVLERGLDPVRMAYRSAIALVSGALLFPVAFLAARSLVYV